jgi:cytochrome c-type biogenesis protein
MIHDVSIPAALIAGLVSFLSPCVLPLVPPYLIYLTGATIEHVANDETPSAFPPCSWRSAPALP